MKKGLLALLFILSFSPLMAQKFIISDANAVLRNVGSFSSIEVSSAIDLYVTQSNEEGLAVSAKETKHRDRIKTEIKGGVLKIWYDNAGNKWGNNDMRLKAYVSFNTITGIKASGASDVFINGKIKLNHFKIEMSGASDFKGAVEVNELIAHISGASDIDIKGIAAQVTIDASGASDFKGYDLETGICIAEASGSSDIKITVQKEISAKASGSSDIFYKGSAVVKSVSSSGSSSVSKRGN